MLSIDRKGILGWEEMDSPGRAREMPPYHAWGTARTRRDQEVLLAPLSGEPSGQMLVATEFSMTVPVIWR